MGAQVHCRPHIMGEHKPHGADPYPSSSGREENSWGWEGSKAILFQGTRASVSIFLKHILSLIHPCAGHYWTLGTHTQER